MVQLRDAILDGRYVPGDKLPPERELAEQFGVNRGSIREALKVLEGLGLVSIRQGDGATVRPVVEASPDVLAPMIFRGGRVDAEALGELAEVMMPLLYEMARLALERFRPEELDRIRALRDGIADESREREERFALARELLVALSDMTRNRVWQMLARRARTLLGSEPLAEARRRLRRDPGRLVPGIDACLAAAEAGHRAEAIRRLRLVVAEIGDMALDRARESRSSREVVR